MIRVCTYKISLILLLSKTPSESVHALFCKTYTVNGRSSVCEYDRTNFFRGHWSLHDRIELRIISFISAFQDCESYKSKLDIDKERYRGLLSLLSSFRKLKAAPTQKRTSTVVYVCCWEETVQKLAVLKNERP